MPVGGCEEQRTGMWCVTAGFMGFPTLQKCNSFNCKVELSSTERKRLCGSWRNCDQKVTGQFFIHDGLALFLQEELTTWLLVCAAAL